MLPHATALTQHVHLMTLYMACVGLPVAMVEASQSGERDYALTLRTRGACARFARALPHEHRVCADSAVFCPALMLGAATRSARGVVARELRCSSADASARDAAASRDARNAPRAARLHAAHAAESMPSRHLVRLTLVAVAGTPGMGLDSGWHTCGGHCGERGRWGLY